MRQFMRHEQTNLLAYSFNCADWLIDKNLQKAGDFSVTANFYVLSHLSFNTCYVKVSELAY